MEYLWYDESFIHPGLTFIEYSIDIRQKSLQNKAQRDPGIAMDRRFPSVDIISREIIQYYPSIYPLNHIKAIGFPSKSSIEPMVFRWFSYGFIHFSMGFPMVSRGFHTFPMVSLQFSFGCLNDHRCFSTLRAKCKTSRRWAISLSPAWQWPGKAPRAPSVGPAEWRQRTCRRSISFNRG